mgnify:CR=1 FL=1|jgi:hypothetical protein
MEKLEYKHEEFIWMQNEKVRENNYNMRYSELNCKKLLSFRAHPPYLKMRD